MIAPDHTDDRVRFHWLSGRIAAGLGRRQTARRIFEHVRRHFEQQSSSYNAALVSLDLAVLDLGDASHLARDVPAILSIGWTVHFL